MGVYIKGMAYADALRLLAKDKKIIDTRNIIEVKEPHGRLIDADELKKHRYHDNNRFENAVAVAQIDWADTIIEAESEEG